MEFEPPLLPPSPRPLRDFHPPWFTVLYAAPPSHRRRVISPGVVDVWEAFVTLAFFPATIVSAYVVDKKPWLPCIGVGGGLGCEGTLAWAWVWGSTALHSLPPPTATQPPPLPTAPPRPLLPRVPTTPHCAPGLPRCSSSDASP